MGERDPGLAAPPAAPARWQRAVLAAALLAALTAVAVVGPLESPGQGSEPAVLARLLVTPLTAISPTRGAALAGVLMLALATGLAGLSLERRIGSQGPLLIALLAFGSACWGLLWTDAVALAPLALSVAAFALSYGGGGDSEQPTEIYRPLEKRRFGVWRWLGVGFLVAELIPSGLLLAGLLLPAALAVPRERRRAYLPMLAGGFAAGLAIELLLRGPVLLTGPVDLAVQSLSLDPMLAGRNLLHLLVGRNVGLLSGFAPLPLLLVLGRGSVARPGLVTGALLAPVLGALLFPWDWAGGWLHLPFLASYGALWFLPLRPPSRGEWGAVVMLCGLTLWPLLASPRAALADGGVELASSWPRRYLPYEDTLRRLPHRGETGLAGIDLKARAVAGCTVVGENGRFEISGDVPATLWLAVPEALSMVALELGPGAPSALEIGGASLGRTVFRPDGRVGFEILLDAPRGRQRLWFGDGQLATHLVEVGFPEPQGDKGLRFRLLAQP